MPHSRFRFKNSLSALFTCGSALLLATGWTSCEEQGQLEPYLKQGFIDQYDRYHRYVPPPGPLPGVDGQILELSLSCPIPLIGSQSITGNIELMPRDVLAVGESIGEQLVGATLVLGGDFLIGMELVGATRLDGEVTFDTRLVGPGIALPITIPTELPLIEVTPDDTEIITSGVGEIPSLSFADAGTLEFFLDDVRLDFNMYLADGSPAPAPLSSFSSDCDLSMAPLTLFSTEVVYSSALTPTPAPVPLPTPEPTPQAIPGPPQGDDLISDTNVQEVGVDEADLVKQNGNHLYAVQLPNMRSSDIATSVPVLNTYRTAGNPVNSEWQSSLDFNDAFEVKGLYLRDSQLIALTRSRTEVNTSARNAGTDFYYDPWEWQDYSTDVRVLSLTTPDHPEQSLRLSFEGDLIESRVVDGQLYLATKFTPQLPFIGLLEPESEKAWADRINALPLTTFLPQIWINGQASGYLFDHGRCHLPDQDSSFQRGYTSITAVIRIDLDNPANWQAKCNSGRIHGVYASSDAFVLTGYDDLKYEATRLDWYDLDTFRLKASGSVPGTLAGNMPSFRLSEIDDTLRILTSNEDFRVWMPVPLDDVATFAASNAPEPEPFPTPSPIDDSAWEHQLFTLRADPDRSLGLISRLPNATRPEPIGKPGETVRSVRYEADRAYVVTFQQTDPLYLINLSAQTDPFIEGELEIEGFSSYLHPLTNNLLLGIGQDATSNGFLQGLKLTLFDTSDASNPIEISSTLLGTRGSYTEVIRDQKAISFLQVGDQTRLAFTWREYDDWYWVADRVYVADIDTTTGSLTQRLNSAYSSRDGSSYRAPSLGYTRVPLQADGLHLVINGTVYSGSLDNWVAPDL